jgi:hypothetical protein
MKIRESDIPKIAFCTQYGLYDYTVLSFELMNAPTYFMYLMNKVFMEYLDKLWFSSMISWYTPRWKKNLKNI